MRHHRKEDISPMLMVRAPTSCILHVEHVCCPEQPGPEELHLSGENMVENAFYPLEEPEPPFFQKAMVRSQSVCHTLSHPCFLQKEVH